MLETHTRGDKAFEGRLQARVSKLSVDVLAMMNLDTTASAKPQELYKPSDVETPRQVSSPANARIIITGNSVPVDIRAGGRVSKQEKHRARDRAFPTHGQVTCQERKVIGHHRDGRSGTERDQREVTHN